VSFTLRKQFDELLLRTLILRFQTENTLLSVLSYLAINGLKVLHIPVKQKCKVKEKSTNEGRKSNARELISLTFNQAISPFS